MGNRRASDRPSVSVLSRGGTIASLSGLAAGLNVAVWYAPWACTVVNVRGYRTGGTGATVNARRNGSSTHLASDLSLTGADAWTDGGAVQDATYSTGDKMEIMITSVAGLPTHIAVQVDIRRP